MKTKMIKIKEEDFMFFKQNADPKNKLTQKKLFSKIKDDYILGKNITKFSRELKELEIIRESLNSVGKAMYGKEAWETKYGKKKKIF